MANNQAGIGPIFRTDSMGGFGYGYGYPYTDMMEKRQVFLRSYQFCRKKSATERIKGSFFRVKRVICVRLRSVRKIRKMVWFRIRNGLFYGTRRRRFLRLNSKNTTANKSNGLSWPSLFW